MSAGNTRRSAASSIVRLLLGGRPRSCLDRRLQSVNGAPRRLAPLYFRPSAAVAKGCCRFVPIVVMAPTMTTEIRIAMKAYSIEVAPASSLAQARIRAHIERFPRKKGQSAPPKATAARRPAGPALPQDAERPKRGHATRIRLA